MSVDAINPPTSARLTGGKYSWVGRVVAMTAIGVMLLVTAYSVTFILTTPVLWPPGGDFGMYRDAGARWLSGGFYFYPHQLAGPYTTVGGDVMYPPVSLVLFVPFMGIPGELWWAIPLAVLAWHLWTTRPSLWGWAGIFACLAWPMSIEVIWTGNPVMWTAVAFALSFRWPWVGVLVLLKPSLFPFALGGIRTRQWWLALAAFAVVSLAFLPMWFDWLRVLVNARGQFSGPLYSLRDVPFMLIPLIAWVTRSTVARDAEAVTGGARVGPGQPQQADAR